MTQEPARYPRSVAGLFLRFILFCLLAAGITWWIAPRDSITKLFSTTQPAARPKAAVNKPPDHPAYVRKENDQDGGHWVVYSDGAFMHANASGSSIQVNLNSNFIPPDAVVMLHARAGALHAADSSLNITDDQRKRLRSVHINVARSATREEREHMRQAWVEYQTIASSATATADAKAAAETRLTTTLAQAAEAARQLNRQRYADIDTQIQNILSADQISALIKAKPTTSPRPAGRI